MTADNLFRLQQAVSACQLCREVLPHPPRPVLQTGAGARLLLVGQAPGAKVHASGIPWDDASGNRLREWMGIDRETFYDANRLAILPMGFCYPGKGKSGDMPPRPECAPAWHQPLLAEMQEIRLTLLIGNYAQSYYLGSAHTTLTGTVANWQSHLPRFFPLPHPSPRNVFWLRKNPWFEAEVIPALRQIVRGCLETD